jgi:putative hemolysin
MGKQVVSLRNVIAPDGPAGAVIRTMTPWADRAFGLERLDELYRERIPEGTAPEEFAGRALDALGISHETAGPDLARQLPASGPVVVVSNHPYGAVEGLVLAHLIAQVRPDLRILANAALQILPALAPMLIPADPLKVSPRNVGAIRRCESHLKSGGVLIMFPAGRVSWPRAGTQAVADGPWHRLVGHLLLRTEATLVPVFFEGSNSRRFHAVGRLFGSGRMALLPRELLRLAGGHVRYRSGPPLPAALWRHMRADELTRYARLMVYALQRAANGSAAARTPLESAAPLAAPASRAALAREVRQLPAEQQLLAFKQFQVMYGRANQMPALMAEIARERERAFRELQEGSGASRDGDSYDESYVQLFVWDSQKTALVGAYRLGHTDELRREAGPRAVYLSQMFDFDPGFYADAPPSLELGRSFIVPEQQKSFHGLYLLWQGIGRYLCRHPWYRRLYGTVSLSRQYDARAMAWLCESLIDPDPAVRPRRALRVPEDPEWQDFLRACRPLSLATLSAIVRALDAASRDVPVLLRHYHRLGARFHAVAVDPNFMDTPGLLLSVDVPALGAAKLATFLGEGAGAYLAWSPPAAAEATRVAGESPGVAVLQP